MRIRGHGMPDHHGAKSDLFVVVKVQLPETVSENDEEMMAAAAPLHHHHTAICTTVERDFLRIMMGGCSTPYAALAEITSDIVHLKANITGTDGKDQIEIAVQDNITNYATLAANAVAAIKKQDVHQLLKY